MLCRLNMVIGPSTFLQHRLHLTRGMPSLERVLPSCSAATPGAGGSGFSGRTGGPCGSAGRPDPGLQSVFRAILSARPFSSLSRVLCPQVAVKSIRKDRIKDEQDLMHIRREIEIMSSLNHPHIIAIHEGTEAGHWMLGVSVCVCV